MLTALDLTFMGLPGSNFGLFRAVGFIVSPVGKIERGGERKGKNKQTNKQTKKPKDGKEGKRK